MNCCESQRCWTFSTQMSDLIAQCKYKYRGFTDNSVIMINKLFNDITSVLFLTVNSTTRLTGRLIR